MSDNTNLPNSEEELSVLYQETIDHHHEYLDKLHHAFNRRCEEINKNIKEKMSNVDDNDEAAKQAIVAEEKKLLDKTLAELKYAINKSNANARKKLEEIQNKMEESEVNLEKELDNV